MSDNNETKVLDHSYDGIQEYDHPLPFWWVATFWITIIFGVPYFIYYVWGSGPSLREEHNAEMAKIIEIKKKYAAEMSKFQPEEYNSIIASKDAEERGAEIYEENCFSCHEEKGKGDIGPNLTDEYWLWAKGNPESIYQVIFEGREDNGMPVWGDVLEKEEIYLVTKYVMDLQGLELEGEKEPQGEKLTQ